MFPRRDHTGKGNALETALVDNSQFEIIEDNSQESPRQNDALCGTRRSIKNAPPGSSKPLSHQSRTGEQSRDRNSTYSQAFADGRNNPPGWMVRRVKDAPTDQRIDDARSLTFDSELIEEDFEILGAPVVILELAVDKPVALLSVKLNEVGRTVFQSASPMTC
ncbi:CocE/NonD family hydrolase C-terminal non-catalytic domain-containing protein [Mesorhizobium sp. M0859]|uniref:CocE/NonD family hydrolase C-terminal non-catalytic domain-containing protein n=1 Tax=Mesorhizobium sp. M0859 TaxID=2957014 RepID=UPI003334FB5C